MPVKSRDFDKRTLSVAACAAAKTIPGVARAFQASGPSKHGSSISRVFARSRLAWGFTLAAASGVALADAGTVLVSVALDPGEGGNAGALPTPSLSADGRFVAFTSKASNLTDPMPNADDDDSDVYLRDMQLGTTIRISNPVGGGDYANGQSTSPSISANGRVIAFSSYASDLVPNDPPGFSNDIYLRDLDAGTIERISLAFDGINAPNGQSFGPQLSADGRMVAFHSTANNLVAGDIQNLTDDVFVHDRQTKVTRNITTGGNSFSNSQKISADGRHVVFSSRASNLVPDDHNQHDDVFVHHLDGAATELVSVANDGMGANGSSNSADVSADGRYVAFASHASNLVANQPDDSMLDLFVRDMHSGVTELITRGWDGSPVNGQSYAPCISDDGNLIGFHSDASNLVPDDTNGDVRDVFLYDRSSGLTRLVHRAMDGGSGSSHAENCGISGDGDYIAFESQSTNLVESDPNGGINDIFRTGAGHDRIFADTFEGE